MFTISPQETKKKHDQKEIVLVDVRTDPEWTLCHIKGAKHISMDELHERASELPKNKEIVMYCHHGQRSLHAAVYLSKLGFKAKSMDGGIDVWSQEVDPSVPRYEG